MLEIRSEIIIYVKNNEFNELLITYMFTYLISYKNNNLTKKQYYKGLITRSFYNILFV